MRVMLALLMGFVLVFPMGCSSRDTRTADQIKGTNADPNNAIKMLNKAPGAGAVKK